MATIPTMTQSITLTQPDDWHLHVRDGDAMSAVVPHTAAQFGRAIIMPNPVSYTHLTLPTIYSV